MADENRPDPRGRGHRGRRPRRRRAPAEESRPPRSPREEPRRGGARRRGGRARRGGCRRRPRRLPPAEEAPLLRSPLAAEEAAPAAEAADSDPTTTRSPRPRASSPAIPGADLEVDIVREGQAALRGERRVRRGLRRTRDGLRRAPTTSTTAQPIAATIDLAADARYRATGKRKTAVARVILKPGTGAYTINGKHARQLLPAPTLRGRSASRSRRSATRSAWTSWPSLHGGGVSAQAGALRHGISRALLEADPNLRSELKRRGFLTRDSRVKERKKAGLKKARKRPQFSKR